MPWNTRQKNIPGTNTTAPALTATQRCDECNVKLVPVDKCNPRDADTWIWTDCEICLEPICENCSDVIDEGRICITCLQSPKDRDLFTAAICETCPD